MAGERGVAGLAGSYEPSNPAAWITVPPPRTIQDALDELAARPIASLPIVDVRSAPFNAKGDGQIVEDGAITDTTKVLTAPISLPFVKGDVGKIVQVTGAGLGGIDLEAKIATFVNAGEVILDTAADTAVSGAQVVWGTDDTAALQLAFDTLAPKGIAAGILGGIFTIAAQVFMPPNLNVWSSSETLIAMLFQPGSVSAFYVRIAFGVLGNVTTSNTPGTRVVQSDTDFAPGTRVAVFDGLGVQGSTYTVQSSTPAGPDFDLTLDRGVNATLTNTATVQELTEYPRDIRIQGNGMRFSGTGQATSTSYIGFGYALRCFVFECVADNSVGSLKAGGVAFNYDLGSVECEFVRCKVDSCAPAAFTLQSAERCQSRGCVSIGCTNAYTMFDCWDCDQSSSSAWGASANGVSLTSNVGDSVGCTDCRIVGGAYNGCGNGLSISDGSSANYIDSTFNFAAGSSIIVANTTGPCLGNVLANVTANDCGSAGGGATLLVQGNGHTLQVSNFTANRSQLHTIYLNGDGCRLFFDGFTSYDSGLLGNDYVFHLNGASTVVVKRCYLCITQTIPVNWQGFFPTLGCNLYVDDCVGEITGGATAATLVLAWAVANIRLRNTSVIGTWTTGVNANNGVAVTVRILEGCSFDASAFKVLPDATAQMNRRLIQAVSSATPIATAFADLQTSEQVKWTRAAAGGTATPGGPLIIPTAGVGWTTTFSALDAGLYLEEAA